jgi:prepilin-type N-terminal cleavage/methylation domain-containing protein
MKLKNLKNEKGFTIIEVLIVLAIAGLIMLVVFLAVPALQRNSRNTQRTADASRIAAAVNECVNNKNGKTDQCDEATAAELNPYITFADNTQLTDLVTANPANVNEVRIHRGQKCNSTGTGIDAAGAGQRSFVVLYRVETNTGGSTGILRCLGS